MINLLEEERIDDLEYKGIKIIQNKNGFCFGIDSVILCDFAKNIKKGSKVLDLGTGTGIISLLLSKKTKLEHITGIEIQKEVSDMAKRSVELNGLEDKIEIINENIKNLQNIFDKNSIDVIVTNPPYKKLNTGLINNNEKKIISRHEIKASLEDFIKISSILLKSNGNFYMVHRPERLVDIMYLLRKYNLEPKVLRFIRPEVEKKVNLVLVNAVKCGKPFLRIENDLIIYDKNGKYTEEILKIYGKK